MAKDPAFLFYPGDWLGGTCTMSRYLKACYFELLIAQFNSGPLSLDDIKDVLETDFEKFWPRLQKKFLKNKQGLFFNERLEIEKAKRKNFVQSRSKNRSGNKKTYEKHMMSHMENENENENENRNTSFEKSEKLFFDLSANELKTTAEYLRRIAQKNFSKKDILNFWEAFKIQYAQDPYENRGKVINHFRNWLKQQKNGNSKKTRSEHLSDIYSEVDEALRKSLG